MFGSDWKLELLCDRNFYLDHVAILNLLRTKKHYYVGLANIFCKTILNEGPCNKPMFMFSNSSWEVHFKC